MDLNKWIYSYVSEKPLNCCRQRSTSSDLLFSSTTDITETAMWKTRCGESEQWQKDQ